MNKKASQKREKIKNEPGSLQDTPRPFLDHLKELRYRASIILGCFILSSTVGYLLREFLLEILLRPLNSPLYYTSPSGGLELNLKVAFLFGAICTIPVLLYQLYSFCAPALPHAYRRGIKRSIAASCLLLTLGIIFAYFILLPASLQFLMLFGSQQVRSLITTDSYFSFSTRYILGFSLVFQLPLILIFLNSIVPLTSKKLLSYLRFVILGSFVVAAVLTPTPDVINQTLLALPIILLYLISIGILHIKQQLESNRSLTISK